MGFLKDIRNLQEQADAQKARDMAAGSHPDAATIPTVRDTGVTTDDDPTADPADPTSHTTG